jgi:hypothetical protein
MVGGDIGKLKPFGVNLKPIQKGSLTLRQETELIGYGALSDPSFARDDYVLVVVQCVYRVPDDFAPTCETGGISDRALWSKRIRLERQAVPLPLEFDISCLKATMGTHSAKLNGLALLQKLVSLALNERPVDKVVAAVFTDYESVTVEFVVTLYLSRHRGQSDLRRST